MSAPKPLIRGSAAAVMIVGLLEGCFFSAGTPPPLADGEGGTAPTGAGGTGGGSSGGGNGGAGTVFVPSLGMQIERMGRPLTNIMLNRAFEQNPSVKDAARDLWNQTPMDQWTAFVPEVAMNLGILDSLDANCGNQFLADPAAGSDRYLTLAEILADDRLWVKLDAASCFIYFAVEKSMIIPGNDCGGRRLSDDVVKVNLSTLATYAAPWIDDGVAASPAKTDGMTFPYLAEPQ